MSGANCDLRILFKLSLEEKQTTQQFSEIDSIYCMGTGDLNPSSTDLLARPELWGLIFNGMLLQHMAKFVACKP
jgi:hypothetical protein